MKVLLITQNFYPEIGSGANRYKNIFKLMKQQNVDVNVLTTTPSYPNESIYNDEKYYNDTFINNHSKNIFRLKSRFKKQSKSNIKRIFYFLEIMIKVMFFIRKNGGNYNSVIVTSPNIFMPLAVILSKRYTQKIILDIRDLWPESIYALKISWIKPFKYILDEIEKKLYNNVDVILYNHIGFKSHIKNKLDTPIPLYYLPNAINKDEKDIRKCKKSDFTVFYTGNIGFAQDYNELIKIAQMLECNKINFDIIPYGLNSKKFNEKIKSLNFNYVKIYEVMPRHECLNFMYERHLSLSFLVNEEVFMNVLPGKIIDSIALGIPVVTNVGNDTMEMINNNNLGKSFTNSDTEEIISYICFLRDNQDEYLKLLKNCQFYGDKNFIWDENINNLIKLLN